MSIKPYLEIFLPFVIKVIYKLCTLILKTNILRTYFALPVQFKVDIVSWFVGNLGKAGSNLD